MGSRNNRHGRMDQARFEQIVAAYGSRPAAWPEEQRDAACAFVENAQEACGLLEQESRLDLMLDAAPSLEPSRALRDRILQAAPRPVLSLAERLDRWASGLWPFGRNWQPGAVLATAAVLGIAAGWVAPNSDIDSDSADVASATLDDLADLGDTQ
jgi:hypothetical protein